MKQFAIVAAVLCMFAFATQEASAQRGHFHGNNFGRFGGSGFAISIGNGFNGFTYARGVPAFGVPAFGVARPFYGGANFGYAPIYRPAPIYRGGFYGGGFYGGGFNRGFYGRPGCGW